MIVRLLITITLLIFSAGQALTAPGAEREPRRGERIVTAATAVEPQSSAVAVPSNPGAVIQQKVRQRLDQYFSSDKYRFSIKPRWIPGKLLKEKARNIVAVELSGGVKRYTNFDVIYRHRKRKKRVQVQFVVKLKKKVPVPVRRLRSGSRIKKDDLQYQWVSMFPNKDEWIEEMEQLIGKRLRRTLLSGQPVRKSYISRDYVVEAGDRVEVIIKKKGIHVQVTGEARENGAKGDKIKVYSSETRKRYSGEVVRPGVILWQNTL